MPDMKFTATKLPPPPPPPPPAKVRIESSTDGRNPSLWVQLTEDEAKSLFTALEDALYPGRGDVIAAAVAWKAENFSHYEPANRGNHRMYEAVRRYEENSR